MNISNIMLYLQQNSYYGSIVTMSVVGVSFVVYSVLVLWRARVAGMDICATAFLPFYNFFIPFAIVIKKAWVRGKIKREERKALQTQGTESIADEMNNDSDEEIDIF